MTDFDPHAREIDLTWYRCEIRHNSQGGWAIFEDEFTAKHTIKFNHILGINVLPNNLWGRSVFLGTVH